MKKILIILAAALLLGCVFGSGCVHTHPTFTYGEDTETTLTLSAGNTLTISAAGNPTTGYVWNVTEAEGLTIIDETYTQDAAEPGMTGVGGTYEWQVTAEEPGTYTFTAEYKRPWEDEVADTMTLTLIFT